MRITAFCTLSTGLISIQSALRLGVSIHKVVGLHPSAVDSLDKISGYVDIREFCEINQIPYTYVDDYSLKSLSPDSILEDCDLIWVTGWQRLLPESFLRASCNGAIGAHGSCDGILKGRGRSPQNWALLMGRPSFEMSLFLITPGVDDGSIITTEMFELGLSDTIVTSYLKAGLACGRGIQRISRDLDLIDKATTQQGVAQYFPKRIPSDGSIDWNMSSLDIYNQIRSLAAPYPRARTFLAGQPILLERAQVISEGSYGKPGEVISVMPDGGMLVAAGVGALYVDSAWLDESTAYRASWRSKPIFETVPMASTVSQILGRFEREFPGRQLNSSLQQFWLERGYDVG